MCRPSLAVPAALLLAATACGAPSENAAEPAEGTERLTVGARAVPAGDILNFIDAEPAADTGLDLEIVEYSDYIAPNAALAEGWLDVDLYRHELFLVECNEDNGTDLVAVEGLPAAAGSVLPHRRRG
ncbi:MetQ/NlpA family ABC transporter substrate-binding protein [Nocardiopsis sp. N85]|uniref:MetQ/NlpA family ABC transporter substrate-binding protein n=1 Tax=Nocardiopsis sp. N85 TaxID=3029400 RepID=UPI00237F99D1|nr:MetQ/NlpA family ABC transporter substrate-binding protein [Nocardiopsis sp. N85]MDE3722000.1 MetQ/NlpA family ABC transporter substrate-binding protein [Nocardiopsis sp. N85]